jgi:Holliday junction resolvase RusA-like endonuclease
MMSFSCEFFVLGEPQPKGSWVPMKTRDKVTGIERLIVIPDNKRSMQWENQVKLVASRHAPDHLVDEPIEMWCEFCLPRPKKPKFDDAPGTKPDLDKLARSTGDALEGIIYANDSRIVRLNLIKAYQDGTRRVGCRIRIATIRQQMALCE